MRSALGLAAALIATPAAADWQYVKWGMTAQQVVTASKGDLAPFDGDGRKKYACIFNDQKEMALAPARQVAGFVFDVVICGSGGKVTSVSLRGAQGNYNSLRASLLGKYGKPIQDSPGDMAVTVWQDQKAGNLVRLSRFLDAGSVEYRAVSQNSGL